jgi:tyrosyl-tRNA synthetase
MTDQTTVTDTRRSLVQAADAYHEQAKTYGSAKKSDGAAFNAWCAQMTAANFANVIAAMLRRVAEDHGEEYATRLAEIMTEAEFDGEDAYWANDDVRMASDTADLALVQARAAADNGNRTPLVDVLTEFGMVETDMEVETHNDARDGNACSVCGNDLRADEATVPFGIREGWQQHAHVDCRAAIGRGN